MKKTLFAALLVVAAGAAASPDCPPEAMSEIGRAHV